MKLLEKKTFSVLPFSLIDGKRIVRFFPHTFYEFSLLWKFIKNLKSRFPRFCNSPPRWYFDCNSRRFDDDYYYRIETVSEGILKPFRLKFRGEYEFYNTFTTFWEMVLFYYPESLEKELSVELSNFLIENNFRLFDNINLSFINTSSVDILKALNYVKEEEEEEIPF